MNNYFIIIRYLEKISIIMHLFIELFILMTAHLNINLNIYYMMLSPTSKLALIYRSPIRFLILNDYLYVY